MLKKLKLAKKQEKASEKGKDKTFNVNKQETAVANEMLKSLDMSSLSKPDQDSEQKTDDTAAKAQENIENSLKVHDANYLQQKAESSERHELLPSPEVMKTLSDDKVKETINKNFQELFQEKMSSQSTIKDEPLAEFNTTEKKFQQSSLQKETHPALTTNQLDIPTLPEEISKSLTGKKLEMDNFPSAATENVKTDTKHEAMQQTGDIGILNSIKDVHNHPTAETLDLKSFYSGNKGDDLKVIDLVKGNDKVAINKTYGKEDKINTIKQESHLNNNEANATASDLKSTDNSTNELSSDVSKAMEELEQLMREKSIEAKEVVTEPVNVRKAAIKNQKIDGNDISAGKNQQTDFIKATDIKNLEEDPIKSLALFKRNGTNEMATGSDYFPENKDEDSEVTQMIESGAILEKYYPSEKNIERLLSDGNNFKIDEEIKLDLAKSSDNKEQESVVEKVLEKYQKASELLTKRLHQLQKIEIENHIGKEKGDEFYPKLNETSADFYGTDEEFIETPPPKGTKRKKKAVKKESQKVVKAGKKNKKFAVHKNGTINEDPDENMGKENAAKAKGIVEVVDDVNKEEENEVTKQDNKNEDLLKWNKDIKARGEGITFSVADKEDNPKNDTNTKENLLHSDGKVIQNKEGYEHSKHSKETSDKEIEISQSEGITKARNLTVAGLGQKQNESEQRALEENQQMINADKQVQEELNEQKEIQLNEESNKEEEKPSDILKEIKADFDQQKLVDNELNQYTLKERKEAEMALQEMDKLTDDEKVNILAEVREKSDSLNKEAANLTKADGAESLKDMMNRLDGFAKESEEDDQKRLGQFTNVLHKEAEAKANDTQSKQAEQNYIPSKGSSYNDVTSTGSEPKHFQSDENESIDAQPNQGELKNLHSKEFQFKDSQSKNAEIKNEQGGSNEAGQANQVETKAVQAKVQAYTGATMKEPDLKDGIQLKESETKDTFEIKESDSSTAQLKESETKEIFQNKDSDSSVVPLKESDSSVVPLKESDSIETTSETDYYKDFLKEKGIEAEKAVQGTKIKQELQEEAKKLQENDKRLQNMVNPTEDNDVNQLKAPEKIDDPAAVKNETIDVIDDTNVAKNETIDVIDDKNVSKNETSINFKHAGTEGNSEFDKNFEDTSNTLLNSRLMKKLEKMAQMQQHYISEHKSTIDPYSTFKRSKFFRKPRKTKKKTKHAG